YLHPSFGYYFEFFFGEPRGLTYKLTRYGNDSLLPPPLPTDAISANEAFWAKTLDQVLNPILATVTRPGPEVKLSFVERLFQNLHLRPETNMQATVIGSFYSRALNCWGVELQKA